MPDDLNPDKDILYQRAQDLKTLGIQPYALHFDRSHLLFEIHENYEETGGDLPGQEGVFTLCGRVLSFKQYQAGIMVVIADQDSTLQLLVSKDLMTTRAFELFAAYLYEGDYIGVTVDYLYRERGELTGMVKAWNFLALANIPIPKHLSVERRRVQQHLYLASNLSAREVVITRARILRFLRQQLAEQGIYDVITAQSDPDSVTNALLQYIVGGIEQVYEITARRNAQTADWLNHSHELWLHCCSALKSPQHMMHLLEHLLNRLTLHLHSTSRLIWQPLDRMNPTGASESVEIINENHTLEIDMSLHWATRSLNQILNDVLDIDFTCISTPDHALHILRRLGYAIDLPDSEISLTAIAEQVFQDYAAPALIQPTFVVFPAGETRVSERFELYINGILLASGRSEVTDPAVRGANGTMQEDFWEKLMIGMPPVSSMALHLDRLAMLMIGATDIRDVAHFLAD
ncbi:MAG: hypothetical protein IAE80_25285 [Anaerolinea sp.]|nr:hypothetical protein [Anaerolinea sp.]